MPPYINWDTRRETIENQEPAPGQAHARFRFLDDRVWLPFFPTRGHSTSVSASLCVDGTIALSVAVIVPCPGCWLLLYLPPLLPGLPCLKIPAMCSANFCSAVVHRAETAGESTQEGKVDFLEDLTLTKLAGVARVGHTSKTGGRLLPLAASRLPGCCCESWKGKARDEDVGPFCTLLGLVAVEWRLHGTFLFYVRASNLGRVLCTYKCFKLAANGQHRRKSFA